jgi:predicted transposase/invertase (TIGR01784 family)
MTSKYFNPYTDFGFKKLFGEEGNKDLLIDFLNQLLPYHHQIAELNFKNTEVLSDTSVERKAIFDIYCESKTGEKFIVEMQKAKLKFFKDRSLFYAMFPIREQAQKGEWDFELLPVYFIAILDFDYDKKIKPRKFMREVCLKDQDGDVFYDKLYFKFLQMPLFKKQEDELETHFDKWLYFLKNLESFDHIPAILNEPIFQKCFEIAQLSHLSSEQYEQYQKSLIQYWDLKNVSDTSFEEGEKSGIEKGELAKAIKVAKEMLLDNEPINKIVRYTQLSIAQIEAL